MPSDLQITNIKDQANANSAITIASDGQVTVNQNNPTITLGSNASMASSGLTVRNITQVALASEQTFGDTSNLETYFSPPYTPLFSGSKVQGTLTFMGYTKNNGGAEGRKTFKIQFTGGGITDIETGLETNFGHYDYGSSGMLHYYHFSVGGPLLTTSNTNQITANCKLQNYSQNSQIVFNVFGNNTLQQTFFTWVEYK